MASKKEPVWHDPPEPKHDGDTISIIIGPGFYTNQTERFLVHFGRLKAASQVFESLDNSDDSRIPLITKSLRDRISEPQVFQVFYDWLYKRSSFGQGADMLETDCYWAMVIDLTVHWGIVHLAHIALDRFSTCFQTIKAIGDLGNARVLPSSAAVEKIFDKDRPIAILQCWMLDHLYWHYRQPTKEFAGLQVLLDGPSELARKFSGRLFQVQMKRHVQHRTSYNRHPNQDVDWLKERGTLFERATAEKSSGIGLESKPPAIVDDIAMDSDDEFKDEKTDDEEEHPATALAQDLPSMPDNTIHVASSKKAYNESARRRSGRNHTRLNYHIRPLSEFPD